MQAVSDVAASIGIDLPTMVGGVTGERDEVVPVLKGMVAAVVYAMPLEAVLELKEIIDDAVRDRTTEGGTGGTSQAG